MTRREAEDIARAAAGDQKAQTRLVKRHMPQIYRIAFRMLGDAGEAEDVVQETFLRAFRKFATWQDKAKFSSWACTVALNLCRDRLRQKKPVLMDALPERTDMQLQPDAELASKQAIVMISRIIDALPPRQREAILLHAVEGIGNAEAAEIMGVSVRALESLLARARRTLKAGLASRASL